MNACLGLLRVGRITRSTRSCDSSPVRAHLRPRARAVGHRILCRAMSSAEHKHTNRLAEEESPYLLQHAHNPVRKLSDPEGSVQRGGSPDGPRPLTVHAAVSCFAMAARRDGSHLSTWPPRARWHVIHALTLCWVGTVLVCSMQVDWYPWGEAAFAKSRAEDKPIFLSVGYSTCHWCGGGTAVSSVLGRFGGEVMVVGAEEWREAIAGYVGWDAQAGRLADVLRSWVGVTGDGVGQHPRTWSGVGSLGA